MKPLLELCSLLIMIACMHAMCSEPDSPHERGWSATDGLTQLSQLRDERLYGWAAPVETPLGSESAAAVLDRGATRSLESDSLLQDVDIRMRGRRALCPTGSSMDCSRNYSVTYSGVVFAALDGTSPSGYSYGCQTAYVQLPSGWIIAPDNAASQEVIRAYPWDTAVMLVANGNSYGTALYRAGLWASNGLLYNGAGGYMPGACYFRVLIQCDSCSLCNAGAYSSSPGASGRLQTQ
jgi:hypothetical protein